MRLRRVFLYLLLVGMLGCSEPAADCTDDASRCDDGIACTVDVCDAQLGCVHQPDPRLCDDGLACTEDSCNANSGCESTPRDAQCDDGVTCTVDSCDPTLGCSNVPDDAQCPASDCNDGVCTTAGCDTGVPISGCALVAGQMVFAVASSSGLNGDQRCAVAGMRCVEAPVLSPPEAACLAFHPNAQVTTSSSGWRQAVYCSDNDGLACMGRVSCHHCPACGPNIDCEISSSTQIEELYVACAP